MNDFTWFGWLYLALFVIDTCVNVARIGRPREPVSPAEAVCVFLSQLFVVWGVYVVGVR